MPLSKSNFLTLILAGTSLVACHKADKPRTQAPSETEAREALEYAKVETWRALYRENDVDGLEAFLTDDFVIIGAGGSVQTKAEILEDLADDPWNMPDDFLYTVTGIVFQTPTSAIVYGHGDSTRQRDDGTRFAHSYTSSNTFRFDEGRWRPVSSHVSDASCQ